MGNMEKKKKRRKLKLIKSLVLVVAFVVAIGATFGITMAYFGGTSGTKTAEMTLKTGLWLKAGDITDSSGSSATQFVVPSQVINPKCQVSIKSSKLASDPSANTVEGQQGSDALLRAEIQFTDESGVLSGSSSSASATYFQVYDLSDTEVGAFVKDGSTNYFYFMPKGTTSITDSTRMQVVPTSGGEVTYKFNLKVTVPPEIGNNKGGSVITLSVNYQVIQADFFEINGNMSEKTVGNARTIFGHSSVQGEQKY